MTSVSDPVCRMVIDPGAAAAHDGTVYYFCSRACQQRFNADPHAYAAPSR